MTCGMTHAFLLYQVPAYRDKASNSDDQWHILARRFHRVNPFHAVPFEYQLNSNDGQNACYKSSDSPSNAQKSGVNQLIGAMLDCRTQLTFYALHLPG